MHIVKTITRIELQSRYETGNRSSQIHHRFYILY